MLIYLITKRHILITHLADDTMIHTNMKLVNAELLQKRWQNTRNPFVGLKMKKDDASGIGTILLTSSGSSSSVRGSTNSPT